MSIVSNKDALFGDIRDSYRADVRAERSRDDVYKRLGGEMLWYIIRAMLIGTLFALVYYHGYLTGVDKPPIEIVKIRYFREILILEEVKKELPATGAHNDSD